VHKWGESGTDPFLLDSVGLGDPTSSLGEAGPPSKKAHTRNRLPPSTQ
jgi:hypothetical protein